MLLRMIYAPHNATSVNEATFQPDACSCCRRSKSQGTFFQLFKDNSYRRDWRWASWQGSFEDFKNAAKNGCRRCTVVHQAGLAYRNQTNEDTSKHLIRVENSEQFGKGNVVTRINFYFAPTEYLRPRCYELVRKPGSGKRPYACISVRLLSWTICLVATYVEDPTSEEALYNCRRWLADCVKIHNHCPTSSIPVLPKTVLKLSQDYVALEENHGEEARAQYSCLSHRWGPNGPWIRLTQSTTRQLRDGMLIMYLPETFYQAARVCLKLGVQYPWIDALCIYQNSREDWEASARSMGSIYENSLFTIAAACGRSSAAGLRTLVNVKHPGVATMPNEGLSLRELRPLELSPAYGENEPYWPLESRGWVFQERLLSPRTLIFSRDQVVWQCRSARHSERNERAPQWNLRGGFVDWLQPIHLWENFLALRSGDGLTGSQILVNEWHRLVTNYARLQLTYHEDRLPAIAALMGQMYRLRGNDVYIAGLWKSSLILDLQWHKPNLPFGQFSESSQPRLSLPVPTWSWASVPGHISYIHASAELSSISKLLDLSFIPVGPANFGYVTDASIALEGPVATAVRKPSKGIFTSQKSSYEIPGLHTDLIRSYPDSDLPKDNKAARISLKVIFLSRNRYDAVEEFSGLVLLEVEHKAYKRDGFVKLRASSYDGDEGKLRELREYVASLPIGCATII